MHSSAALERAVRVDGAAQRFAIRRARAISAANALPEGRQIGFAQRQAGRHGVAAESVDQVRMLGRDAVEGVANIDAGNGARRTAQRTVLGARERDDRPMQPVLDSSGDQSHHALMPALIEKTNPERLRAASLSRRSSASSTASSCMRCSISRRSSLSLASSRARRCASAGSSANRHAMPTLISVSRPAAFNRGATANPKSAAVSLLHASRPADSSSARMPATQRPARMRLSALRHQDSIVAIERHHIGNRPQRDQIQTSPPTRNPASPSALASAATTIKRHADAGQRRTCESAARQIGIHDHCRRAAARLPADDDRSPAPVSPISRAASTPATLDTPLSTVTISDGARVAASATISGVRP